MKKLKVLLCSMLICSTVFALPTMAAEKTNNDVTTLNPSSLLPSPRTVEYSNHFNISVNGKAYSPYIAWQSSNVYITPSIYKNNPNSNFTVKIYMQEEDNPTFNTKFQMSFNNNNPKQGYFYGLNPNKKYRLAIWIYPNGNFANLSDPITVIVGAASF